MTQPLPLVAPRFSVPAWLSRDQRKRCTLTAIMGQMAIDFKREVTWEEVMASG
jgi:hypothetical protein